VKKLGAADAIDADTIFPTGSTGKAFTVADLAILVDQGKIGWDDKVIDHLPGFEMYDPWATREITIRDLLVHRSGLGLGAGDLLFVPRSNLSRAEVVKRLRYIKPATSFRYGFAYDNLLYIWPTYFNTSLVSGFGVAMISVLWAYEGWQFVTYNAGEVINAKRNSRLAF
jgi:CubicO group peptidase (beta-lactamase class C family)